MDMIFLGMRKNGLCAFYVAAWCLYLYQGTFSFISDDEIYFQTRVFTEIIKLASLFCEDVGNEILKYGTFITEKVTSKNDEPDKVVCAFTLANAGVRVSDLPNARRKKIETGIPHAKALKYYPAVLVARLGVSSEFRSKHIGSDVLDFIKLWFIEPLNKTGCRFVIVDAYNTPKTMAFYEQNGFTTVFSTEQQEKDYRHITSEATLSTRLMFYDLMSMVEEYR